MALERFIPKSPDPFIRNSQDFEVAKFGHLNTIIEYVNSYVVTDSLQLAGSGPITSTARYITDSTGVNSAISIGTTRVGIGTDTPSAELHIDGHNGFGASLKITTNKVNSVAYVQMISDYVTGIEQYQYGGPGWGWPNWTTTRAGGTAAAPTAVPSNYGLNEYTFWGHDGTAGGQAYSMMTRTSETWTPTAHGIYTVFNTVATGSTSLVERMRFTGTGNITFNNASDTAKVAIKGSGSTSATTSLLVQNSSGTEVLKVTDNRVVKMYGLGINADSIEGKVLFNLSNDCIISTPTSFQVKSGITDQVGLYLNGNNGYVGVGTTNPTAQFTIGNTDFVIGANAGYSTYYGSSINGTIQATTSGSTTQLWFRSNGNALNENDNYWSRIEQAQSGPMRILSSRYGSLVLGNNGFNNAITLYNFAANQMPKVGINNTTPTALFQITGTGSTSATTSLLVQNSSGSTAFQVRDNLTASIGDGFTGDGIRFEASGNSSIIFRQGADRIFLTRTNGDQLNISFISGINTLITSSGICNDGSGTNIWKFEGSNTASVTMDTTKYLKVYVGGVAYKLAVCV